MELKKPKFDLDTIKNSKFEITTTAALSAAKLGYTPTEVRALVKKIEKKHFYKSMTANHDSRIWQDVYHFPSEENGLLYIKFSNGNVHEFSLLSFKEK